MTEGPIEEESFSRREMKNRIYYLENRLGEITRFFREDKKVWQNQLRELIVVNTRLEKEIKKYKQQEANKLAGFLSIGAVYEPEIDRTYKFKE
jgi:hypothetical protein